MYLTYASSRGHALIDRALYLPTCWTSDPGRRGQAGVPDKVGFATKPALARQMITRTLEADISVGWVAGDEVYGADPSLRAELEDRRVGYVLAVACSHRVRTHAGARRVDTLAATLPPRAWQRLSAGHGSKGPRFYDWAWVSIDADTPGQRWLLIRRNNRTGELAYYRCYAFRPVPLSALVAVAGRRWTVEESFQASKGLTGLDQHQLRRWNSWHRWTVLAMLAYAFLAVLAATERARKPPPDGLIPLTCNEIHHLLSGLTGPIHHLRHRLRWSRWRRRHQHRAQTSHYQRRTTAKA